MLEKRARQCHTVTGRTPEEFDERFNALMLRLAEQGYGYDVEHDLAQNVARVFYWKEWRTAETVKDEYIIGGRVYKCGQCPCYMPMKDRRYRNVPCIFAPYRVGPESSACDYFYEHFAPEFEGEEVREWTR